MALSFTRRAAPAAKASAPRAIVPITDYAVDVATDSRGQDGLVIQPMAGDVKHPKAPNFWIRLEDFDGKADPTAMRALGRSLPRIAAFIAALDAKGVEAGAWSADGQYKLRESQTAPTAARAVAPKPATKPSALKSAAAAVKAAAEADGAVSVDLDGALGNLPF